MVKTIHLKANVPNSREVRVVLPPEVPTGPADLVVLVASQSTGNGSTLGDILQSGLFGAWRDRGDIGDSGEFARRLREDAWKRSK